MKRPLGKRSPVIDKFHAFNALNVKSRVIKIPITILILIPIPIPLQIQIPIPILKHFYWTISPLNVNLNLKVNI